MPQIPVDSDLLQNVLNYMTTGSVPKCTWHDANQIIVRLMQAAQEYEKEHPEEFNAATEHGGGNGIGRGGLAREFLPPRDTQ